MPASRTLRTPRHVVALSGAVAALATLAAVDWASAAVPWHLDRVDQRWLPLDGRFDPCASGSGATIYIVGTGIDATHPEFAGRAQPFYDALGGHGGDRIGHGTWLASLAGGEEYGVARGAQLRGVRVFDDCGRTTVAILRDAFEYIASRGPRPGVVVLPFAFEDVPQLDAAVADLRNAGLVVVAAAGDEVRDACDLSPGRSAATITVGASTMADDRAEWSAYDGGSCIDVYAPGETITAAWPAGQTMTLDTTAASAALAGGVGAVYAGLGESLARIERKLRNCTSGNPHPILLLDCGCRPGPVRDRHAAGAGAGAGATSGRSPSTPTSWYRLVDEIPACPSDLDGDCAVGFSDLLVVLGTWGPCVRVFEFDSLIGIGWAGEIYGLDTTTGEGTPIGDAGVEIGCNAMASDSRDRILVYSRDWSDTRDHRIVLVDPVNGGGSILATLSGMPEPGQITAIAIDSSDRLFANVEVTRTQSTKLARIDLETGAVTIIGDTGVRKIEGLAFDEQDTLYFVEDGSGHLGTIDVATGLATLIGGSGAAAADHALEFDADGRLYGAFTDLVEIDPATGIATPIGPIGAYVFGLAAPTASSSSPSDECPVDLDGSGAVDFGDLLVVLSDWGPCD